MLPEEVLARRNNLPLKPAAVTLVGRFVRLEPLSRSHAPALHRHSDGSPIELAGRSFPAYDPDELIWRYLFVGPFADFAGFERYIDELICGADRLALCVTADGAAQVSSMAARNVS